MRDIDLGRYEYRAKIGNRAAIPVKGNDQLSAARKVSRYLKPPGDWMLQLMDGHRAVEHWRFNVGGEVVVR